MISTTISLPSSQAKDLAKQILKATDQLTLAINITIAGDSFFISNKNIEESSFDREDVLTKPKTK